MLVTEFFSARSYKKKSLPATKALIDLLNSAQPVIEQAETLYSEAQPLIDQAVKEWQAVSPAAQILIDAISHHLDRGGSPADAAEAVRAVLGGSIKNVAQNRRMDRGMSRTTGIASIAALRDKISTGASVTYGTQGIYTAREASARAADRASTSRRSIMKSR